MRKRIMVDMSLTILHHGHIRLINKASEMGDVIIGLTTDEEILKHKGYTPELSYDQRKEILLAIKNVSEVVPTNWKVTDEEIEKYNIDVLLHAGENSNSTTVETIIVDRTEGVSSSEIRERSADIVCTPKRNILLNPGPATTTQSVKMAQVVSDICPRETEFGDLMAQVSKDLTEFVAPAGDYYTTLFAGSGTAAVESCIASIPQGKVLIINNGAYGKRMCQIAERYGIDYDEFKSSGTDPLDMNALQEAVQEVEAVFAVHNETTTGLLNDIEKIGAVCGDRMFIVDAMSSYGAIPIDMEKMNIDFLVSSSNKNIQGTAGVSFVIGKNESMEKIKDNTKRAFYLDLYDQYHNQLVNHQMRFTPPVQTMYALQQAIEETKEETTSRRYARYSAMWELLTEQLKDMGMEYLVADENHSKIITSIKLGDIDFNDLHDYFYDRGITIYPGKVDEYDTFRIANIGAIDVTDMAKVIGYLKEYLK